MAKPLPGQMGFWPGPGPEEMSVQDSYLTKEGYERPDGRPVEPPVGYRKQPSMVEIVRDMVRSEKLRQEAEAAGMESFEESEDFDVGEDYEPDSPYENDFDPPLSEIREEVERSRTAKGDGDPQPPSGPAVNPKAAGGGAEGGVDGEGQKGGKVAPAPSASAAAQQKA